MLLYVNLLIFITNFIKGFFFSLLFLHPFSNFYWTHFQFELYNKLQYLGTEAISIFLNFIIQILITLVSFFCINKLYL